MRQPVAYIRKSRVIGPGGVSWDVQEEAVKALAGPNVLVLSDWNRSGRGTAHRPGYQKLLELVAADQVSLVAAYSLSRFARSVKDFTTFADLCITHGVAIRFATESSLNIEINGHSATNILLLNIMASFAQFEADIAKERSKEGVAVRRQRGDHIGPELYGSKPGEDPEAVVKAYRDAGGIAPAARLLNVRKVPTRAGKPWGTSSVHDILIRTGAMPRATRRGAKASAPYLLYGLLVCHCGRVTTGDRSTHGYEAPRGAVRYRCHRGRTVPGHGLWAVPEVRILPWIKAEASRLTVPEAVEIEQGRHAERDKIEARKLVIADMYETNGPTWREEYQRRMAALKVSEDALEAQEAATAVLEVPQAIDWENWTPEAIHKVLAAMWRSVRLNESMEPIAADWRRPEWRAP
jgi:DNA invertase Pin-like site-specific DNA recombinase